MMNSPLPLIDLARLRDCLGSAAVRFDVDALAICDSTSSLLLDRVAAGAPSGTAVIADRQTAGRGRRGRNWQSSPADSLTFSLLWRFPLAADRLAGLSLAVGVAVVRALESFGAQGIGLKWPNDVLYQGQAKLGGILIELQGGREATAAVIGIGLNLQRPDGDLGQPAAGLAEALATLPERHQLLAALLTQLAAVLDQFTARGFAGLRDAWQAHHAWQNQPIRLLADGQPIAEGICLGADADGALLVAGAEGTVRHLSGELSLRMA